MAINDVDSTCQSLKSYLKTKWLYFTSPEAIALAAGAFLGAVPVDKIISDTQQDIHDTTPTKEQ